MQDIAWIALAPREVGFDQRIGGRPTQILVAPVEENTRHLEDGDAESASPREPDIGIEMMFGVMRRGRGVNVITFNVELDELCIQFPPFKGSCDVFVRSGQVHASSRGEIALLIEHADDTAKRVSKGDIHIPIGRGIGTILGRPGGLLRSSGHFGMLTSRIGGSSMSLLC